MVSHCHKLGQSGVPEDGIVWQANVSNVEVNELGTVVLALPKGDGTVEPSVTPEKGLVG